MRPKVSMIGFLILACIALHPAYGSEPAGNTDVPARIAINEKERLAVAAAFSETVITRRLGNHQLEAEVFGHDPEGCKFVVITELAAEWEEINTYRICDGLIAEDNKAESELSEKGNLENLILVILRKAQHFGMAQGIFQNYTVKAFSLKQDDKCKVKIEVYKSKKIIREEFYPCS